MVLLAPELRNYVATEIKNGTSINKISKNTGYGKSTIYYYYKKINGKKYKEP